MLCPKNYFVQKSLVQQKWGKNWLKKARYIKNWPEKICGQRKFLCQNNLWDQNNLSLKNVG